MTESYMKAACVDAFQYDVGMLLFVVTRDSL